MTHRLPGTTVRPEPDELANARTHWPPGTSLEAFLRACLRAMAADPDAMRQLLDGHWPPERPRGRPRKNPAGP